jgi:hypothetical protein
MEYRHMCSYEILEAIEGESVVIGQGQAFALNRSTEGRLRLSGTIPLLPWLIQRGKIISRTHPHR